MYVTLWEFTLRPGAEAAFEALYGPTGPWTTLFRQAAGYLGTELLRPRDGSRRYLTIDRWISADAWHAFHERFRAEYRALDAAGDALTESERHLGEFTALADGPGR